MRPIATCVALMMLLSAASGAATSEKPPTPNATPPRGVRDTVTVLPPVDVESTRHEPARGANPSTVRLDRSQLVRFQPSTPVDAIASAPGVELIRTGPWASRVSVRGLSGERVLVLVDGVRLNTGRGHGTQSSLVSVDRLDQVELIPGAGGAEFGSDAMGGVVNLVTHRPLFSDQSSLTLSVAARGAGPGEEYAQSSHLRFRSRDWGAEFSGGFAGLKALVTPDERVPNSGDHETDVAGRVAARLAGTGLVDAEYTRHAAHDIGLPAFNEADGATGNYPLQSRAATRLELRAPDARPFAIPLGAQLLAVDQTYHSDFDETTVDSLRGGLNRRFRGYKIISAADRITTRQRGVQPELRFGDGGALRLSGEWRHEGTSGPRTVDSLLTDTEGNPLPQGNGTLVTETVPNARRDVLSGAIAATRETGALRLQGGARYDWLRSRSTPLPGGFTSILDVTDRRTSWDGTLAYHVEGLESYVRVATGFRAPNLEERYFNGFIHGGLRVFGDPDLVPERSTTYETGVNGTFDRASFRVSAYRSSVDDYITFKYIGMLYKIPRFQFANVRRARIEGVELVGRARVSAMTFGLSATAPRGRDLDARERLDDVGASRVTLELGLPLHHAIPQGTFAFRARWCDAIKGDPAGVSEEEEAFARPAFWSLTAEVGATLGGARATFAVRNLMNHYYKEPLSFIEECGRMYSFGLKRDFELPAFGLGKVAR